jgi:hypothetical protein
VWLAKLTEKGLLQPSFVPPYEIRRLRELTRLRTDLVHDKSRYWARLEKLLERALIKISAVLSTLDTDTARAMIEALIAGNATRVSWRTWPSARPAPSAPSSPWRWRAGGKTTTASRHGSCWTTSVP